MTGRYLITFGILCFFSFGFISLCKPSHDFEDDYGRILGVIAKWGWKIGVALTVIGTVLLATV